MNLNVNRTHLIRGTVVTVGIFASLAMWAIVPRPALSQLVVPGGENVTGVPRLILPPAAGGNVVFDPSGDDVFSKDCTYAGVGYSPGATGQMPNASGGTVVKTCQDNGEWK
jgi:hypothetical protein